MNYVWLWTEFFHVQFTPIPYIATNIVVFDVAMGELDMRVTRINPGFGAEITGIDLNKGVLTFHDNPSEHSPVEDCITLCALTAPNLWCQQTVVNKEWNANL